MAEQTLLLQQTDKFTQQCLLSEIHQDDLESVFSSNVYDKEIQIWKLKSFLFHDVIISR